MPDSNELSDKMRIVEAILFASAEPISEKRYTTTNQRKI